MIKLLDKSKKAKENKDTAERYFNLFKDKYDLYKGCVGKETVMLYLTSKDIDDHFLIIDLSKNKMYAELKDKSTSWENAFKKFEVEHNITWDN